MEPTSIPAVRDALVQEAHTVPAHRAARTVCGGSDHALRQTLIALVAGAEMSEHENPGEATLHVLEGRVRLGWADRSLDLAAGDHVVLPQERHGLAALEDAVVLLTAAKV